MAQKQPQIQHSSDDPLALAQIDEMARELGIDLSFVGRRFASRRRSDA